MEAQVSDIETLKERIKNHEATLELLKKQLENKTSDPRRPLDAWCTDDKVEVFDRLWGMANQSIEEGMSIGYYDDDNMHHLFEAVMELLPGPCRGKEFWTWFNNIDWECE